MRNQGKVSLIYVSIGIYAKNGNSCRDKFLLLHYNL